MTEAGEFNIRMTISKKIRRLLLVITLPLWYSCNETVKNTDTAGAGDTELVTTVAGKKEMRMLTDRPLNLETPLHYFLLDYTPNDVFFVRWHLATMPDKVDPDTFRLRINGDVKNELALSLQDLKTKFKPYSLVALAQCAGNARSFFDPHVSGGQWKNGAMGNAKWTGVKLKDLLDAAGIKKDAFEVSFNGMDQGPLPTIPDFVKSLSASHCMDGEVMVAYQMNDADIPMLNGYPLKLVVPGWYATYWVGMLNEIRVYPDTFQGFWMKKAYQVPKDVSNGNESPDSLATKTVPISKMDVRSVFVTPEPDSVLTKGKEYEIQGLAFDGGDGISKVEISSDNGKTWKAATLDAEISKYSWRRFRYKFTAQSGTMEFISRATNVKGETQPEHQWNRSGYMRNEIEKLKLIVQ